MGSISGGGRYDDLTGIFGLQGVSGVGISFGADRIYDVLLGLNLFPPHCAVSLQGGVMFVNFGSASELAALRLLAPLRDAYVACEIYPDPVKLKKQFDYASRKGIIYLVFIGEDELAQGTVTIKNIVSGQQLAVSANVDALISFFKNPQI